MPGYNAYDPYYGTMPQNPRVNQMNNNIWNNGWNNTIPNPSYTQTPQRSSDGRVYVNGRAGADAYPLPNGINIMTLWDTDSKRFYVKGYDNNGMPRVLEDNDYGPHVQQEQQQSNNVDLSAYATKDDIQNMISEAFNRFSVPNLNRFVTKNDFDKALSELSVGNGGRIVRANESNG